VTQNGFEEKDTKKRKKKGRKKEKNLKEKMRKTDFVLPFVTIAT
jgi:hypothetical protein